VLIWVLHMFHTYVASGFLDVAYFFVMAFQMFSGFFKCF
jgi:hypothetical protein